MTEPLIGWRWWQLTRQCRLIGMHTPQARRPWPAGADITALCNQREDDHGPEEAPWPDCECGIRIMPRLSDLLDAIRNHPARVGVTPQTWRVIGGPAYFADRMLWGVLHVPDVIGQVVASGRIEPECVWDDPPGTMRAERARVGARLYVSRHLSRERDMFRKRYPQADIRIGTTRGLAWLDEIAEDCAGDPPAATTEEATA